MTDVLIREPKPYKPEIYAKVPFDPTRTFRDDKGNTLRHIFTPYDETYMAEPADYFAEGSLPPEECEVRDHVIVYFHLREQITPFEQLKSMLFGATKKYAAYQQQHKKLKSLCAYSRAHRAAFCRLANGEALHKTLRMELQDIVSRCDRSPAKHA